MLTLVMNPVKFLLLLAVAVAAPAFPVAAGPNVVIFFTDDQGTLDAGCFGAADLRTPNIDRLAETGVRFTQAYAHTVCCPARAALMTGRHPQRGGVNSWTQGNMKGEDGINMALEEVTLAELLKAAGYRTALFGKWHLGAHRDFGPMKQGFDEFFGIRDGFIDNYNHYFLHESGFHDLYEGTREVWARGEFFPEMIVERSLDFIERNKDTPFFLYLAFNTPHYPEQAQERFLEMYEGMAMPRRSYAAFTTNTDHYIGRVLDALEKLELRKETIVIFMSDNGHSEENAEIKVDDHESGLPKGHYYSANGGGGYTGKWIGHKGTFLEGGIRVPAILSYPAKLPKGIARDQAVTAMDWFPTVLELCGVEAPAGLKLDGHSVLPLVADADAPTFYEVMHWQWISSWAIREGDWKLIAKKGRKESAKELYSLHNLAEAEPEKVDYAGEKPQIVERLRALHDEWATDVVP